MVLNFWATWCGPCRELEPLFENVAAIYADRSDVVFFAANADEDEALVKPFLDERKWKVQVVFPDGLDDFLRILSLPTIIVVDHSKNFVTGSMAIGPEEFSEQLTNAIDRALPPSPRR